MAKAKTQQVTNLEGKAVVMLTVDTLIELVNRVNALEQRIEGVKENVEENWDYMVRRLGFVTSDGMVRMTCLEDDGGNVHDVYLKPVKMEDADED